ncbi:hypothetical protein ACTFIW_003249 [Dictyostelium discoideum]
MIKITLILLLILNGKLIFSYPFSDMGFQDYPNLPYIEFEPTLDYYDGDDFHDGFSIQVVNEAYAFSQNLSIKQGYLYLCQGISAGIKEIDHYDDYSLGWFNLELRVNHHLTCIDQKSDAPVSSEIIFQYIQPQSEVSSHKRTSILKFEETINVQADVEYSQTYGKTTSTQSYIKDWNVRQTQMIGSKTSFLYYQDYPWIKTPPEISLSFINQRLFIPFKISGLCKIWEVRTEIQPTLGFVLPQVERLYLKSKLYTNTKKYQTTDYIINGKQEDLSKI